MNPPIRSKYHQKELWNGIYNGTVDVIGSDHAPHTLEEEKMIIQIDYPTNYAPINVKRSIKEKTKAWLAF